MGGLISRVLNALSSSAPRRILLLGLDAAGKTTVLYKLHLGEAVRTIPTVGFNVETVNYKNLDLTIWDVGGQDKIRRLWRHYYTGADALIFVVDSNDKARMNVVQEELEALLATPELCNVPVLLFANKQDLPNSMSVSEVTDKLGLHAWRTRDWYIQGCAAVSGDGLYEGLDWLNTALTATRR